jgi:hypothetical protein
MNYRNLLHGPCLTQVTSRMAGASLDIDPHTVCSSVTSLFFRYLPINMLETIYIARHGFRMNWEATRFTSRSRQSFQNRRLLRVLMDECYSYPNRSNRYTSRSPSHILRLGAGEGAGCVFRARKDRAGCHIFEPLLSVSYRQYLWS